MSLIQIVWAAALLIAVAVAFHQWSKRRELAREHHIRAYVFPNAVLRAVTQQYPGFTLKEAQLIARALRQFFLVHARSNGQLIAMPSKATDALWHAFILDTRRYKDFCQAAFGRYLHHIPEGAMKPGESGGALWQTWRLACLEENINPYRATRLPLLFAIDAKLGIPDAVTYDPAAMKPAKPGDGAGGGGCGGTGGKGGDGGDGDGGGGGDGGGCGGGCGGE